MLEAIIDDDMVLQCLSKSSTIGVSDFDDFVIGNWTMCDIAGHIVKKMSTSRSPVIRLQTGLKRPGCNDGDVFH